MKRKIGATYFNDELVYDGNDLGAVYTKEKTTDPWKDEEISDVIQELIIEPLNRQTKKVLQGVTLEDMEEEYLKHNEEEYMYYI